MYAVGLISLCHCSLFHPVNAQDKSEVELSLALDKTSQAIMGLNTTDAGAARSFKFDLMYSAAGESVKLLSPRDFSMALLRSKLRSNTFDQLTSFVGQNDCMYDKGDRILHALLHIE